MKRICGGLFWVALTASLAQSVSAAESTAPATGPTYQLRWSVDLPLLLIPAAVSFGWIVSAETRSAHCAPLCDRSAVNAIDRGAAGNYSRGWATFSDFSVLAGIAAAATVVGVDEGFELGMNDFVVGMEAILLANATTIMVNLATRRPRPLLYGTAAPLEDRNSPRAALSFFSGHVTVSAAISAWAFTTTYRRSPNRVLPWVVLGSGALLTTGVAVGRVAAGRHFPSDVLIGALVGVSYGFLLPALHEPGFQLAPMVDGRFAGASARWQF